MKIRDADSPLNDDNHPRFATLHIELEPVIYARDEAVITRLSEIVDEIRGQLETYLEDLDTTEFTFWITEG